MPRPICGKCGLEMPPRKNGVWAVLEDADGLPYQIWHADLAQCPLCEAMVVTGFGQNPVAERGCEVWEYWLHKMREHSEERTAWVVTGRDAMLPAHWSSDEHDPDRRLNNELAPISF